MNRMITKSEFKREIIENGNLALVQFKLEWSGACQIISGIYEDLASSYSGKVNFFTVDVEKEEGLDSEYGILELPTILFFEGGRVVDFLTGLTPRNILIDKITDQEHNVFALVSYLQALNGNARIRDLCLSGQ